MYSTLPIITAQRNDSHEYWRKDHSVSHGTLIFVKRGGPNFYIRSGVSFFEKKRWRHMVLEIMLFAVIAKLLVSLWQVLQQPSSSAFRTFQTVMFLVSWNCNTDNERKELGRWAMGEQALFSLQLKAHSLLAMFNWAFLWLPEHMVKKLVY